MMMATQARKNRRELFKSIAREERKRQREELRRLVAAVREARANRTGAIRGAKDGCRKQRVATRVRILEVRARLLAELKETTRAMRDNARAVCSAGRAAAREHRTKHGQARETLRAERAFRAEMRRIEAWNKERRREVAPKGGGRRGERRRESDDEVRGNIPPDLAALFERVKGQIRGSDRMSRTEAFLHYAEEHPGEVLASIDDVTDRVVRELEEQERKARRAIKRPIARTRIAELAQAVGDEPPF